MCGASLAQVWVRCTTIYQQIFNNLPCQLTTIYIADSAMSAFVIAFILPCGSFIVIENQIPTAQDGGDREESWVKIAWGIFTFAIIGTVTCTMNTLF